MKRLLILIVLVANYVSGQKLGADVIKFDSITSAIRDAYAVPYGEFWLIYNGTTGQFEYSDGSETWEALGGGASGGIVAEGLQDITDTGGVTTVTITHNLGYAPSPSRIGIQLFRPNQQTPTGVQTAIGNITTTSFDLLLGGTGTDNLTASWRIFGNGLFEGEVNTDDQTAAEVPYTNTTSGLTATDVQEAIDEVVIGVQDNENNISTNSSNISQNAQQIDSIVTVLATPAVSQFVFVTQTVADTAVVSDARDNRVVFLDYDNENFTIPAGVFETGNAVRIQSIGTGTARIVPADGVSFAPWDGFQLDSIGKAITLARVNFDTAPEDWLPIDGYIKNYFEDPSIGNLLTADFYGNISFPNSTTAPTFPANVGSVVITQENGTVFYGTTAMRYDCDSCGTNAFVFMDIPTTGLTTGDSITVTFRYYNVVAPGSTRRVRLYDLTTGFSSFDLSTTTGEWLEGSVTHTLGQASGYRLYFAGNIETIFDYIKVVKNP